MSDDSLGVEKSSLHLQITTNHHETKCISFLHPRGIKNNQKNSQKICPINRKSQNFESQPFYGEKKNLKNGKNLVVDVECDQHWYQKSSKIVVFWNHEKIHILQGVHTTVDVSPKIVDVSSEVSPVS